MIAHLMRLLRGSDPVVRRRATTMLVVLLALNVLGWAAALLVFRDYPLLMGTCLLAYSFGLRHAVDADHIAAIDNVTRKLMQAGDKPVAVGFFFSLGHSTIVFAASALIAITATAFKDRIDGVRGVTGVIGAGVSSLFLVVIAIINVAILADVWRTFRAVRLGGAYDDRGMRDLLDQRGFLNRLCRPLFRLITRSWHMYPLGFLFGLGFDTATEVGLLGISGAEAAKGLSIWAILVFPLLFTVGMALVDTLDGMLMLGAYGWAFVRPLRKLYYNMTITSVSVVIALLVGGIEALGLIGDQMKLEGDFWDAVGTVNDNFGLLGYGIIGIFVLAWLISSAIYKYNGFDDVPVTIAGADQLGND
jgi:nickel/cobalt transporter (NiCoT) family protein